MKRKEIKLRQTKKNRENWNTTGHGEGGMRCWIRDTWIVESLVVLPSYFSENHILHFFFFPFCSPVKSDVEGAKSEASHPTEDGFMSHSLTSHDAGPQGVWCSCLLCGSYWNVDFDMDVFNSSTDGTSHTEVTPPPRPTPAHTHTKDKNWMLCILFQFWK